MQPLEPSAGRSVRLALVAVAVLALLAIVAFASRSGLGHSNQAKPTPGYVNYAFTAFLILFVLAIPVAAWAFLMQAREGGFQRKSLKARLFQNFMTVVFFLLIAVIVVYIKRHHGHIFGNNNSALEKAGDTLKNAQAPQQATKYAPHFEWLVFWIAVAGATVMAAAYLITRYRRKRRRPAPLELPTVTEDLAASMSDSIDDLEAETDARAAVIAAYARMEGVLARHGLRRQPSEAPLEYLRRILLGITARADAVTRLTGLFEQAKFSLHDIDASMKDDAIGALREIRDDLRGAPA